MQQGMGARLCKGHGFCGWQVGAQKHTWAHIFPSAAAAQAHQLSPSTQPQTRSTHAPHLCGSAQATYEPNRPVLEKIRDSFALKEVEGGQGAY